MGSESNVAILSHRIFSDCAATSPFSVGTERKLDEIRRRLEGAGSLDYAEASEDFGVSPFRNRDSDCLDLIWSGSRGGSDGCKT